VLQSIRPDFNSGGNGTRTEKMQCLAIWTPCMHRHRSAMYSPINVTSFIYSISVQWIESQNILMTLCSDECESDTQK
jgi:hypothetical protein